MSTVKRQVENEKKKSTQRRYGGGGVRTTTADWRIIENVALVELIQAACETGGAIRFGVTRDGGAYALGVYGDGPDPYTLYAPTPEEMGDHITHLTDVFEAIKLEQ